MSSKVKSRISAGKKAQVKFDFSNGQGMSIIWGWGAYTEESREMDYLSDMEADRNEVSNSEVEIMPYGEPFSKWLMDKYDGWGDSVIGYISVDDLPEIIAKAASYERN